MLVQPYELEIGLHVLLRGYVLTSGYVGIITTVTPAVISIKYHGDSQIYSYSRYEVLHSFHRVCANCDIPREDHPEGGKCLYSPTNWC